MAPGLLLLIFFSIQVALWLYGRHVALQAAREAISQLRIDTVNAQGTTANDAAEAQAVNYVNAVGGGVVLHPSAVATLNAAKTVVTVTVTGHAVSLVPGITLGVSASAEGQVEQFQVDR